MRSRSQRIAIANKIRAGNFNRNGNSELGAEKYERANRSAMERDQSRRPRIRAWRAEDHKPKEHP